MRFAVHVLTDHSWRITFTQSHAVTEGWSYHSMLTELIGDYRQLRDECRRGESTERRISPPGSETGWCRRPLRRLHQGRVGRAGLGGGSHVLGLPGGTAPWTDLAGRLDVGDHARAGTDPRWSPAGCRRTGAARTGRGGEGFAQVGVPGRTPEGAQPDHRSGAVLHRSGLGRPPRVAGRRPGAGDASEHAAVPRRPRFGQLAGTRPTGARSGARNICAPALSAARPSSGRPAGTG